MNPRKYEFEFDTEATQHRADNKQLCLWWLLIGCRNVLWESAVVCEVCGENFRITRGLAQFRDYYSYLDHLLEQHLPYITEKWLRWELTNGNP